MRKKQAYWSQFVQKCVKERKHFSLLNLLTRRNKVWVDYAPLGNCREKRPTITDDIQLRSAFGVTTISSNISCSACRILTTLMVSLGTTLFLECTKSLWRTSAQSSSRNVLAHLLVLFKPDKVTSNWSLKHLLSSSAV